MQLNNKNTSVDKPDGRQDHTIHANSFELFKPPKSNLDSDRSKNPMKPTRPTTAEASPTVSIKNSSSKAPISRNIRAKRYTTVQ